MLRSTQLRKTKKHMYQEAMEYDVEVDDELPKDSSADWDMLQERDGYLAGSISLVLSFHPQEGSKFFSRPSASSGFIDLFIIMHKTTSTAGPLFLDKVRV